MNTDKQVKKNFYINILLLLCNVVIGILYTPYLLNKLGEIAYSVVPIAIVINQYISILTGSLTNALTRFYTIAVQRKEFLEASRQLSTLMLTIIGLVLVFTVCTVLGKDYLVVFLNISDSLVFEAKILFQFTIFGFLLSVISSILNITLYAKNRLDYINYIKIVRILMKFVFVVLLFNIDNVYLYHIGVANFITELLVLFLSTLAFYKYKESGVFIKLKYFDKKIIVAVGAMAFWVIIQQSGDMFLFRSDTLIMNWFFGEKNTSILGAISEFAGYLLLISTVISSLFGPIILIEYSKDNHEAVKEITLDNSLIVGVLMAFAAGIFAGFSSDLLVLWTKQDYFSDYSYWLTLKSFLIPFYSSAGIFAFVCRSWNKIVVPAMATLILGIINFVLLWYFSKYLDAKVEQIIYVGLFFGIIQSYLLNGFYFSYIYKGTLKIVVYNFMKITIMFFLTLFCCYYVNSLIKEYRGFLDIILPLVVFFILVLTVLFVFFNKRQRLFLFNFIKK